MRAAFGGSPLPRLAGFDGEPRSAIDTSPMTGVVLVLLIIFLVVTPAVSGPRRVKARTADVVRSVGVVVGIDDRGNYFLGDRPIHDDALVAGLRREFAARPGETTLYLAAHDEVEYARVLTVLDAARDARVRRLTALVELPRGAR
ncbi:MAG TPA: biopolymer transporter ExbD [Longimicrobium sp.]